MVRNDGDSVCKVAFVSLDSSKMSCFEVTIDDASKRQRKENMKMNIRVSQPNIFFLKKMGPTHSHGIWGLVERIPKGFLIWTSFKGCT